MSEKGTPMRTPTDNRPLPPVRVRTNEVATAPVMVVGDPSAGARAGDVQGRLSGNATSAELLDGAMGQRINDWLDHLALWVSVASLLVGTGAWEISQQLANRYQGEGDRAPRRSGPATVTAAQPAGSCLPAGECA